MTTADRKIYDRLQALSDRLLSVSRLISAGHVAEGRALYSELKAVLRAQRSMMATARGKAELSSHERRWYQHPVRRAAAELTAPTNASVKTIRKSVSEARAAIEVGLSRMRTTADTESLDGEAYAGTLHTHGQSPDGRFGTSLADRSFMDPKEAVEQRHGDLGDFAPPEGEIAPEAPLSPPGQTPAPRHPDQFKTTDEANREEG